MGIFLTKKRSPKKVILSGRKLGGGGVNAANIRTKSDQVGIKPDTNLTGGRCDLVQVADPVQAWPDWLEQQYCYFTVEETSDLIYITITLPIWKWEKKNKPVSTFVKGKQLE